MSEKILVSEMKVKNFYLAPFSIKEQLDGTYHIYRNGTRIFVIQDYIDITTLSELFIEIMQNKVAKHE